MRYLLKRSTLQQDFISLLLIDSKTALSIRFSQTEIAFANEVMPSITKEYVYRSWNAQLTVTLAKNPLAASVTRVIF